MSASDVRTPLLWALGLELFRDDLVDLREGFRTRAQDEPMETTLQTVLVAASLFYAAEHGQNPKIDSFAAALEYITTSLSVGSINVYPVTEAGKLVASAVMTVGPAIATNLLGPTRSEREAARVQEEASTRARDEALLAKLDAILGELRRAPASGS